MKIEFVKGAEDIKAHKKFIDTQDDDYMYWDAENHLL